MKCSTCGDKINPFDGWSEITRRQMIEPGAGNPEHPVALVTTRSVVLCVKCDEFES